MTDNNIHVETELRLLPSLYWLPKLHKTPYGTRFIAASRKCTNKPLSKLLTVCLEGMLLDIWGKFTMLKLKLSLLYIAVEYLPPSIVISKSILLGLL